MAITNTTRASFGNLSVNILVTSDSETDYTLGSEYLLAGSTAAERANNAIYSEFLDVVFDDQNAALTRFAELGGQLQVVCTQTANVIDPNPALTVSGGKPAVFMAMDSGLAFVRLALAYSASE